MLGIIPMGIPPMCGTGMPFAAGTAPLPLGGSGWLPIMGTPGIMPGMGMYGI